jgi:hypothetical protein
LTAAGGAVGDRRHVAVGVVVEKPFVERAGGGFEDRCDSLREVGTGFVCLFVDANFHAINRAGQDPPYTTR